MPRPTRAELESELEELRDELEEIHSKIGELLDLDESDGGDDEE